MNFFPSSLQQNIRRARQGIARMNGANAWLMLVSVFAILIIAHLAYAARAFVRVGRIPVLPESATTTPGVETLDRAALSNVLEKFRARGDEFELLATHGPALPDPSRQ